VVEPNIALVYVNNQDSPGMGVAYLLSYWRAAGIDVHLFDTFNMPMLQRHLIDFDVVAFSTHTLASKFAEELAYNVKSFSPSTKVIWGGPDAMARPEELAKADYVDFICIGEGEHFVPELFNNGFDPNTRGNYPNGLASPVSCEDMLYPDLEPWRSWCESNYVPVMLGRGCPYSCTYCSNSYYKELWNDSNEHFYRTRPMDQVFTEIESSLSQFPKTKGVGVHTETFGEQVERFTDEYKRRGCTFSYVTSSRPDALTEEKVRRMVETNCVYCGMGIEAGEESVRRKYLKRYMTDEQIIKAFGWLHDAGIETHSFNIIGLPGEDLDSIKKSVELNRKCGIKKAQYTILYPFQKTAMRELYEKKGWVNNQLYTNKDPRCFMGMYDYYNICAIDIPNFTPQQLFFLEAYLPKIVTGDFSWEEMLKIYPKNK
jgi:radical SAM superfamily enzyme YgiQ (UPF0313 family)